MLGKRNWVESFLDDICKYVYDVYEGYNATPTALAK